jgi:hypothetical protein
VQHYLVVVNVSVTSQKRHGGQVPPGGQVA